MSVSLGKTALQMVRRTLHLMVGVCVALKEAQEILVQDRRNDVHELNHSVRSAGWMGGSSVRLFPFSFHQISVHASVHVQIGTLPS